MNAVNHPHCLIKNPHAWCLIEISTRTTNPPSGRRRLGTMGQRKALTARWPPGTGVPYQKKAMLDEFVELELPRFRGHINSEHERRGYDRERIKRTDLRAGRWSSWCSPGGHRTSWLGSTSLRRGRSATGWPSMNATQDSAGDPRRWSLSTPPDRPSAGRSASRSASYWLAEALANGRRYPKHSPQATIGIAWAARSAARRRDHLVIDRSSSRSARRHTRPFAATVPLIHRQLPPLPHPHPLLPPPPISGA